MTETELVATAFITAAYVVAGICFGQRAFVSGFCKVLFLNVLNIRDEYGESNSMLSGTLPNETCKGASKMTEIFSCLSLKLITSHFKLRFLCFPSGSSYLGFM